MEPYQKVILDLNDIGVFEEYVDANTKELNILNTMKYAMATHHLLCLLTVHLGLTFW